jgi:hypothetical protein
MKKHHWYAFRYEMLFEKQPLPHCQTYLVAHTKEINMQDRGSWMRKMLESKWAYKKVLPAKEAL